MSAPLPEIHPQTWRFMRGIYLAWYSQHPESSLADWLSDMRRAHSAIFDMDIQVDRMLGQSIAILEYAILGGGGQLPRQITALPERRHERLRFSGRVDPDHTVIELLQISEVRRDIGERRTEKGPDK